MTSASTRAASRVGGGIVLLILAAGQFLMTLDSSVMNVSIATGGQGTRCRFGLLLGGVECYPIGVMLAWRGGAMVGSVVCRGWPVGSAAGQGRIC